MDDPRSSGIPADFVAVPIAETFVGMPLSLGVLMAEDPDAEGGPLISLRETLDASVVLGCVFDQAGIADRWIELWIQNLAGVAQSVAACREALSNHVLDDRWRTRWKAMARLMPGDIIATGWEHEHPSPVLIDRATAQPVHPVDPETGEVWRLCRDDAMLTERGLPPYSTSLHRYLVSVTNDGSPRFAPITDDAPTNESVVSIDRVIGDHLPLNVGAGLMMARTFDPISYEDFLSVLSGERWDGQRHGRRAVQVGTVGEKLAGLNETGTTTGRLFLGRAGRAGRLIETLHLKLHLLAEAVRAVHQHVRETQMPLLGVTADGFSVRLHGEETALPFLWSARARLVEPSQAVALPIETTDLAYHLRARGDGVSIYHPVLQSQVTRGRGTLRIRKIMEDRGRSVVVEGTFDSSERIDALPSDLHWMRLTLAGHRFDLYGRLSADAALAAGEWRFRSTPQELDAEIVKQLRQAEGAPLQGVPFDLIPLLSTPSDLYALGVLAVRTLLVNQETTLAAAVDEVQSLARQMAETYNEDEPIALRVQAILTGDDRWLEAIGPHRITDEAMAPRAALGVIPAEVWCTLLAAVVRAFPGLGPESTCRDFGDATPGGIHQVFEPLLEDLDGLIRRTRSLIVIDWRANREIHTIVRRYSTGTAEAPVPSRELSTEGSSA